MRSILLLLLLLLLMAMARSLVTPSTSRWLARCGSTASASLRFLAAAAYSSCSFLSSAVASGRRRWRATHSSTSRRRLYAAETVNMLPTAVATSVAAVAARWVL